MLVRMPFNCGSNLRLLRCKQCDFTTSIAVLLKRHTSECHKAKPIEVKIRSCVCKKCGFETYSILNWIKHNSKGCAISYQQCDKCGYRTSNKWTLMTHVVYKHLATTWYRCDSCDYKTKKRVLLKEHTLTRHPDDNEYRWFQCDQCKFKTRRFSYLKRHRRVRHTDVHKIKWYGCDRCGYRTKRNPELKQHIKAKHLEQPLPIRLHPSDDHNYCKRV